LSQTQKTTPTGSRDANERKPRNGRRKQPLLLLLLLLLSPLLPLLLRKRPPRRSRRKTNKNANDAHLPLRPLPLQAQLLFQLPQEKEGREGGHQLAAGREREPQPSCNTKLTSNDEGPPGSGHRPYHPNKKLRR
jgi:hypothetical protein